MASGIYEIVNTSNGHRYIGSAATLRKRKLSHFKALSQNNHVNIHLQRAWNKYGYEAFEFHVIEYCVVSDLIQREQHYLDTLHPEYNIYRIAGSPLGTKASPETRAKVSAALKGNKHTLGKNASLETRSRLSESLRKFWLTASGKERRSKISMALKGNKNSLGHKHTVETKAKMSAASRPALTPEHRSKLSASLKGHKPTRTGKHSDETKAKMSEARKSIWQRIKNAKNKEFEQ